MNGARARSTITFMVRHPERAPSCKQPSPGRHGLDRHRPSDGRDDQTRPVPAALTAAWGHPMGMGDAGTAAAAALRAVAHLLPDALPLLAPLKRTPTDRTDLAGVLWVFGQRGFGDEAAPISPINAARVRTVAIGDPANSARPACVVIKHCSAARPEWLRALRIALGFGLAGAADGPIRLDSCRHRSGGAGPGEPLDRLPVLNSPWFWPAAGLLLLRPSWPGASQGGGIAGRSWGDG